MDEEIKTILFFGYLGLTYFLVAHIAKLIESRLSFFLATVGMIIMTIITLKEYNMKIKNE